MFQKQLGFYFTHTKRLPSNRKRKANWLLTVGSSFSCFMDEAPHGYTGSAFKNISGVYSTSAFKFYTAFYLKMVSAFGRYHTAFSSD